MINVIKLLAESQYIPPTINLLLTALKIPLINLPAHLLKFS
jgi:hypothetical protein